MSERGDWFSDINDVGAITKDYFCNLFSSSYPILGDIQAVLDLTDSVIGEQMNEVLCAYFTAEEVRRSVFDMHPSKAPGLMVYSSFLSKALAIDR